MVFRRVQSAPVKFLTAPAKNSSPILAFKFLNGEASKFRTFSLVPCERNPKVYEFSTGRNFVRYRVNVALVVTFVSVAARRHEFITFA